MGIDIIHLSDCHFRSVKQLEAYRLTALAKAVAAKIGGNSQAILVVSGDIAFSGKKDEYLLAAKAFNQLKDELLKLDVSISTISTCPGNHDCNFEDDSVTRRMVVKLISSKSDWDETIPATSTRVQRDYFEQQKALGTTDGLSVESPLFHRKSLDLSGATLEIWTVNSAWMSQNPEKSGGIWFPVHLLQQAVEVTEPTLRILVMHHTLAWFHVDVRRTMQTLMNSAFDMVLMGHEHIPETSGRDDLEGQRILMVDGGVFHGHSAESDESSFNTLRINLDRSLIEITSHEIQDGLYREVSTKEWSYTKSSHKVKPYRVLTEKCSSYLRSAGATYRHPLKADPPDIYDIYIDPDFIDLDYATNTNHIEKLVSAREVIANLDQTPRVVVGGGDKAGKTCWIRWIYLDLHGRGLTPVRIEGASLASDDIKKVLRLVEREYLQQYTAESSDEWKQLDPSDKVLLIDDLDASDLNRESRRELLKELGQHFGCLIVTCDEGFLLQARGSDSEFESFKKFQLVEFGHRLRDTLIGKWLRLGREHSLELPAFQLLREQRVRAINALIGKSFVPARPIFLLTLLQGMEVGSEVAIRGSSLGEYYEYLIRHALLGARVSLQDLDAVQNYLSEMAYMLVCKDTAALYAEEATSFEASFAKKYALRMNFTTLRAQLTNADILEDWNGQIRFKYRYVLLFFGAKHLAKHFGRDDTITKRVKAISKKLHISKYADLMLFIVHHSNDPTILDMVIERAEAVFTTLKPIKLDSADMEAVNKLVTQVPQLVYRDGATEERREEKLRRKDDQKKSAADEMGRKEQDLALSALENDDAEEVLDYVGNLALGIRVLAIVGQILRNYYGSLDAGRKEQLATTGYALVGRVLRSLLNNMFEDKNDLASYVTEQVSKRSNMKEEDARRIASRFLFGIASFFVFSVIKRASEFLGSDKLLPTHESVAGNIDSPFGRLIELAVTLEHPTPSTSGSPREIPLDEIGQLQRELEKNPCADLVLRRLVLDYLYMFDVSYKDRQRICEMLGISIKRQRQVGITTHRKRD